jgi:hypothetical protein
VVIVKALPEILLLDPVVVVMIVHVVRFVPPAMVRLFAHHVQKGLALKRVVRKKRERAENLLIVSNEDGQEILIRKTVVNVTVLESTIILMEI